MKIQFDTEKEAQEALDAARLESYGWCPVIKADCRKDCTCYEKGYIGKLSSNAGRKKYWRVQYPYCTNVLISGVITVES